MAPQHTWNGIYASFAEAPAEDTVFEGRVWLDKLIQRTSDALSRLGSGDSHTTSDYVLPVLASTLSGRAEDLRILDFGGGMAAGYIPLLAALPQAKGLAFSIVENSAVCEAGRELFADHPKLEWLTGLPPASARYDIVQAASSLHYVEDWRATLRQFCAYQPSFIVLSDVPAGAIETFVTVQNFHGRGIPVWFWNLDDLVGALAECGYRPIFDGHYRGKYLSSDQLLPMDNFDPAHRLDLTRQLIFQRHQF